MSLSFERHKVLGFILIGVLATALDFVTFAFLIFFGQSPILGRAVGYAFGTITSISLNLRYVQRVVPNSLLFTKGTLVYISSGCIATIVQGLGNEILADQSIYAVYFLSTGIAASINFVGLHLVARDKTS